MASCRPQIIKTFIAEEDLSSSRYFAMKFGTTEKDIKIADANAKVVGVLQNAPTSGQLGEVAMPGGGALCKINETVSAGKFLTSTASGKGEVADAAHEHVFGYAQDAGVQDDVIAIDVVVFEATASDA